jgi:uncharacterized membrane protein
MPTNLFSTEHLHPLMVHFPVALLLTAPLLIIVALVVRGGSGRAFALSALILLALGTAGAWAAVATGEAAEDAAHLTAPAKTVLERHEDLAQATAVTFTFLSALLAAVVLTPVLVRRLDKPAWVRAALAVVLLAVVGGDLLVAKAAHEGGRLVHEFGSSPAAGAGPAGAHDAHHNR